MATVIKRFWTRIAYLQNSAAPFWVVALVLGLIQVWANRFYMGNDGVPYLDMANAYLRGDWHTALNGFWNPLYAWLIGVAFLIFRPSPYWEYPVVELLNFGIYAATLASFEYFLRGWLAWRREDEAAVRVVAYGLFLWSSLILIGVWTVNADMLVAACVYAALGLLLRTYNGKTASALTPVILGVTLATGYYSKAAMFPISLVLLLIAGVVLRWRRALIAALVFGLLSAPLVAGISKTTGHLTFSDTGRLNYAWFVNGVPHWFWQGGPPVAGVAQHPPRILLDSPRVYEFGGVFPEVTYPIWYDSSYWYQGLRMWIDPRLVASAVQTNLKSIILKLLARQGGAFLLGWGICFLFDRNKAQVLSNSGVLWPAWCASIAAILLYSMVLVETRYVGAFAAVLLLTAFTATRLPSKRVAVAIVVVGLVWAVIGSAGLTQEARTHQGRSAPTNVSSQTARGLQKLGLHAPNMWWQAATGLQKLGLRANDKVASVGWSNGSNVFWARLARAHIVAETDADFWRLSAEDQQRTLAALARSGAMMAVSDETPPSPALAVGWQQAGSTHYYAYSLAQSLDPVQSAAIPLGVGPGRGGER